MNLPFLKTDAQIVEEIHNAIDTAQDRLLKEAHAILAKTVVPEVVKEEADLASRLSKIGFVLNPIVKKTEEDRKKSIEIERKKKITEETAKLIEHYRVTYPFLKFLTEEELDRICTKYKLIYAPVSQYIKVVPEKNLKDIETAQPLKAVDSLWEYELDRIDSEKRRELELKAQKQNELYSSDEYGRIKIAQRKYTFFSGLDWDSVQYYERRISENPKSGLFIAAPKSHFDLSGLVKRGLGFFRPEPKDPIVFRYVKGGVQVITKWGLEANDPALVLPINN